MALGPHLLDASVLVGCQSEQNEKQEATRPQERIPPDAQAIRHDCFLHTVFFFAQGSCRNADSILNLSPLAAFLREISMICR